MHTGEDLEGHLSREGRLSCNSDAPQVASAWFGWTRDVKVNRRKMNHPKTRPHCIIYTSFI